MKRSASRRRRPPEAMKSCRERFKATRKSGRSSEIHLTTDDSHGTSPNGADSFGDRFLVLRVIYRLAGLFLDAQKAFSLAERFARAAGLILFFDFLGLGLAESAPGSLWRNFAHLAF
jgi:hypothetical protein